MNNIIEIRKIKNIRIKNIHNNMIYPIQDILEITFENGKERIIDLMSKKDITDINYFKVIKTWRTKSRIIFIDNDFYDKEK